MKTPKDKSSEYEKYALLSYLWIHKVIDPDGRRKAIIPVGDGWKKPYQTFVRFFNRGVTGDKPSKTVEWVQTEDDAMKILKREQVGYRRIPVEEPFTRVEDDAIKKVETGKYNVCVFLSTALEGVYEKKAYHLGNRIQQEGMGLIYGVADRNMMGGLYHGSVKHFNDAGSMTIAGSTTSPILTRESERGKKPELIPDAFFYLAPNITARKRFLFKNSHAFVCLEGGPGTLDELLTYLWFKENEPEMVKGKPMFISESAYVKGDSLFKEVLDTYMSHLPHGHEEKDGIIIMPKVTVTKLRSTGGAKKTLYEQEVADIMEKLELHRKESSRSRVFTPPQHQGERNRPDARYPGI